MHCILQRSEGDERINGYNMELLRFGRVNMDLQYNQGYGAKTYMCKYITKQAGPKQATIDAGPSSIAYDGPSEAYAQHFHYRSVGVVEAIMDICGCKMHGCSHNDVFLPTDLPDNRKRLLERNQLGGLPEAPSGTKNLPRYLQQEYDAFKVNNAKQYWEFVKMKYGLKGVAREAAVVTAKVGLREAYEQYSTNPAASSKTTTRIRQPEFPEAHVKLNSTKDMVSNENENEEFAGRSTSTPSDASSEKALNASKIMRKMQSSEYGDTSDSGRKADCLFMMRGVELSNIEIKHPDTCARELAIQNRKNIRLARCIQEAHTAYGVNDSSVLMADVYGFVGDFYQVKPMGDIAIAGKTTSTVVHLPRTSGALEEFLEDSSLAIIWNFMSYLEEQGPKIVRAKERFELIQEKAALANALSRPPRSSTPSPVNRIFQQSVNLTPSKKRTWTMSGMV
ncbi:hypothetical protein BGW38_003623 [Lunasporangiospora selenospora]|uniref:Uncharacterized protein n=1 Tax=Lunasporangiospora selenospora TaxID=979761 RepID=A0A9P6G3D8_9FUNG|nr:hypothetical protein BGW38_003623 [Lunasporangiospora selenospora]